MLARIRLRIGKRYNEEYNFFTVPVSALGEDFSMIDMTTRKQQPLKFENLKPFNVFEPLLKAIEYKKREEKAVQLKISQKVRQLRQLVELKRMHVEQEKEVTQRRFDEVNHRCMAFLDGSLIEKLTESLNDLRTELSSISALARKHRIDELDRRCVDMTNRIQRRSQERRAIAAGAVVAGVFIAIYLLLAK